MLVFLMISSLLATPNLFIAIQLLIFLIKIVWKVLKLQKLLKDSSLKEPETSCRQKLF